MQKYPHFLSFKDIKVAPSFPILIFIENQVFLSFKDIKVPQNFSIFIFMENQVIRKIRKRLLKSKTMGQPSL